MKFTLKIHIGVIICANLCQKSLPIAKLGQVEVGSNIDQNRLFSREEVICGYYMCQLMKISENVSN